MTPALGSNQRLITIRASLTTNNDCRTIRCPVATETNDYTTHVGDTRSSRGNIIMAISRKVSANKLQRSMLPK